MAFFFNMSFEYPYPYIHNVLQLTTMVSKEQHCHCTSPDAIAMYCTSKFTQQTTNIFLNQSVNAMFLSVKIKKQGSNWIQPVPVHLITWKNAYSSEVWILGKIYM